MDLIIMATSSPDDAFGSATTVQAAIGAVGAAGFDLTAACSGFVMGLVTGSQFIRAGTYKTVLVIGGLRLWRAGRCGVGCRACDRHSTRSAPACSCRRRLPCTPVTPAAPPPPSAGADALSRYIDWRDRGTCILFGDGCGAVVLRAADGPCGLLGMDMHSGACGQGREAGWVGPEAGRCWRACSGMSQVQPLALRDWCLLAPPHLATPAADGTGMRHLNCAFQGPGLKPLAEDGHASDQVRVAPPPSPLQPALPAAPAGACCAALHARRAARARLPSALWTPPYHAPAGRVCKPAHERAGGVQVCCAHGAHGGCPGERAGSWQLRGCAGQGVGRPAAQPCPCRRHPLPGPHHPCPCPRPPARQVIEAALADAGMGKEEIDWLVRGGGCWGLKGTFYGTPAGWLCSPPLY